MKGPFPWVFWSVWELWRPLLLLVMSVVSQRPHQKYMVLQWGRVDLQKYANGSFVSNNNILTILFFNTYCHIQINKMLIIIYLIIYIYNYYIAAFNETFRQSLDPVYTHTPMRNVGELRTFNPKLRTSPEAKSITGKVKGQGHIMGQHRIGVNPSYQFVSLLFHANQTNPSCDIAISKLTMNIQDQGNGLGQGHIVSTTSYWLISLSLVPMKWKPQFLSYG